MSSIFVFTAVIAAVFLLSKQKRKLLRLTEKEYRDIYEYASEHNQTVTKTLLDGLGNLKHLKKVRMESAYETDACFTGKYI